MKKSLAKRVKRAMVMPTVVAAMISATWELIQAITVRIQQRQVVNAAVGMEEIMFAISNHTHTLGRREMGATVVLLSVTEAPAIAVANARTTCVKKVIIKSVALERGQGGSGWQMYMRSKCL